MSDPMSERELSEIRARAEKATLAGFPGYEVHSDGSIWSIGSNWRGYGARPLVQHLNKHGYMDVRVTVAGKRKKIRVHQAVAEAFYGPRPTPEHEVRHLNGKSDQNHRDNLRWGTRAENAADRDAHGTTARGEGNGMSKLNTADVIAIRAWSARGYSQRVLARKFEVSQPLIGQIIRREWWKHV